MDTQCLDPCLLSAFSDLYQTRLLSVSFHSHLPADSQTCLAPFDPLLYPLAPNSPVAHAEYYDPQSLTDTEYLRPPLRALVAASRQES